MNNRKYKKMDKFVNEMNQSVTVVGDMSIYLFNRFRNFVGYLFITITTVAISFIVAEFIRDFQFAPVFGVDTYFLALFSSLIIGLYIAFYGEEAKIATIKGAIFSSGNNRTWQAGAALSIILVLIIVNAKGVQRIADFSLRYMDTELKESVVFKLKEQKMKNHSQLATVRVNTSSQDSALRALFKTRESYQRAKQREIQASEQALSSFIAGRDSVNFRSYITNKKLETSRDIAHIEDRWEKKITSLDTKIAKAQDRLNSRLDSINKTKQNQLSQADKATEELISHYKHESTNNKNRVDKYKDIGLIVAIGGEVVDGMLAFLLFMIVKSNPNVNGTPSVQPNTRKMVRMKSYDSDNLPQTPTPTPKPQKKTKQFEFAKSEPIDSKELTDKLFTKIKKVSSHLSKDKNEFIKVGMNRYLKHPSQREIIKAFNEHGITITPSHVSEYFTKMEDEIMFVNQKIGFVYTQIVKKLAA